MDRDTYTNVDTANYVNQHFVVIDLDVLAREAVLKKRAQRVQRDGDLKKYINPSDFARYLSMLMSGLGVQAANGATKTELKRYANRFSIKRAHP